MTCLKGISTVRSNSLVHVHACGGVKKKKKECMSGEGEVKLQEVFIRQISDTRHKRTSVDYDNSRRNAQLDAALQTMRVVVIKAYSNTRQ